MADFRALLEDRSTNAAIAWLSTGVLVLAAVALLAAGELLWPAFALLTAGVVLLPPALDRDLRTTMPGELVAVVALPAVLRATGLFLQVTPFVAVAGLALLVVLALDGLTSLEMAPRFAVVFVVITTMAFAGGWAIAEFAADVLLGTDFVGGQREMNLNLLTATVVGVFAGVACEAYFRLTDGSTPLRGPLDALPFGAARSGDADWSGEDGVQTENAGETDQAAGTDEPDGADDGTGRGDGPGSADVDGSEPEDGVGASPTYRYAIRALQVVLVGIVGYSLVTLEGTLFVNSSVPLALTLLPAVARRRYDYPMHARLALLIAFAATLHAVGALGPYATTDWYDTVTHALSSTLVAGVGYAVAHGLELHTDRVSFSPRFRGAFIVLFVLAVGVLWELLEFGSGLAAAVFGGEVLAQYGVDDIVKDLVFNTVGALLVALWGTELFRRPARALAGNVGGLLR